MVYLDYAWKILFVVMFFGLCIFVHELGHLLVALWRGLYVERFSIGFGKKIWGVTHRGVEYVVSWLPFGGYVALPQLDPSDQPRTSQGEVLPVPSAASRALTAAAGPVANIIFGFVLATFTWWYGVYEPAPATECTVWEVPQVLPLFKDGLREGDTVTTIKGERVSGPWDEVSKRLTLADPAVELTVQRKSETLNLTYHPEPNPEYVAGLRPFDRIVRINGAPLTQGWEELRNRVVENTEDKLKLTVERAGQGAQEVAYVPARNPATEGLGYPFFTVILPTEAASVLPGSAAAAAGFRRGDRLVRVDGQPIPDQGMFIDTVQASEGKPLAVTVLRDGQEVLLQVQAKAEETQGRTAYRIGVALQGPTVLGHPNPWVQCREVLVRTQRILSALVAPVRGKHSLVRVGHMSGPLGIFGMIWAKIVTEGIRGGLSIIILVTFSLAIFNLLPIPVLDGGHIMYSGIEVLIRRRLPAKLVGGLQQTFAVLLIGLMLYITYRDVLRIPRFWRAFSGPAEKEAVPTPAPAQPAQPAPATDKPAP
jgi:regulator of sigma E protease